MIITLVVSSLWLKGSGKDCFDKISQIYWNKPLNIYSILFCWLVRFPVLYNQREETTRVIITPKIWVLAILYPLCFDCYVLIQQTDGPWNFSTEFTSMKFQMSRLVLLVCGNKNILLGNSRDHQFVKWVHSNQNTEDIK